MAIYSEDNPNVSSSVLLSSLLNIMFMDGAEQVIKMAVNDGIDRLLFIDAIPDSKRVNMNYDNCMRIIKQNNLESKIHLIPVICAEYYVITSIVSLGLDFGFKYRWYNVVLEAILRKRTISKPLPPHIKYKYKGNFDSFEQQCKTLLYGASEVFMNYNIKENKNAYRLNKISYFLNDTHGITIYDKVINLAKKYPIVRFKNGFPDGFREIKNIIEKTLMLQDEYDKWKSEFKKIKLQDDWWEDCNVDIVLKQISVL